MVMFFLILALVFVVLLVIITNIVIVPQSKVYVVERLGSYSDTWSAGLHIKIPFIERIAKKVSLKEQVADFPPQPVITRDNVTMQIDTVVFFQVMDAKLYTYGVNQPIAAIESLSATTLRNIIGEMELDHTLTSRDVINGKITAILDEATDKWGIKVNRVEVKNIIPPREIQEAMEKQMKAEREKRAVILKADGEKQAAITAAEGEKEAAILRADAVKQHIDDIFHIAYNRNFCFNILTDFSRVNVNVNYLCVFTHLVGSRNSSVTESCTAYDYKVGFVKSTVGNSLAVSAEHSEIKLMLAGHNTDAHHS